MKILTLGAFLICSFTLSAQQFVSPQEALVIVDDMEVSDMQDIQSIQDPANSTYVDKKFNVHAYRMFSDIVENSNTITVEGAIKESIRKMGEFSGFDLTEAEYDTDTINNDQLSRLKDHLVTILTQ